MKKKILVIDDSRLAREMLSRNLSKHSYLVDVAVCGREGLKKVSKKTYHLCIIDYILPDMDGLELMKEMGKKGCNVPVIILTGGGSEEVAVKAMKLGALDYVVKEKNYCDVILHVIKEDLKLYQQFEKKRLRELEKRSGIQKLQKDKTADHRDSILVVDDSVLARDMLYDTLTRNDYDVDVASGGCEALSLIAKNNYDLAIVDYMMPDKDGLQVLREIGEKGYAVPVIIFTGKGSEEVAVKAMKLGAIDYVVKGIGDMQVLPSIIKENLYIHRADMHREYEEAEQSISRVMEKLLIVDDSRQAREMTCHSLASLGYDVDIACGGHECLDMIARTHYDLAIVDYMMPDMTGLEILKEVSKQGHDVPIIVFTGKGSEDIAVEAMKLGALDYVVKTVGYLERLSKIVQRNLNIHRMKEEKKNLEHELMIKNQALEERIRQLRALNEISKRIGEKLDLNRTLTVIVSKIAELLHCARITVMLFDGKRESLSIRASKGFPEEEASKVHVKIGEDISGYVARQREPLFTVNIEEDQRFHKVSEEQYFNKSLISVPMIFDDDVIGVINVNNKRDRSSFNIDDRDILMTIAYHAAIAIENARRFEQAQKAAVTDVLTGLYNQRYFFKSLDVEIERARRYKTKLSLIIIDLDDFKRINDQYGHQQGDIVLTEMSQNLKNIVRKPTILARYGGEEFAIIVPEADIKAAAKLAERLRAEVEKCRFSTNAFKNLRLTISLGIAEYGSSMLAKDLVGCADKALYEAKNQGKNTCCLCHFKKVSTRKSSAGSRKKTKPRPKK